MGASKKFDNCVCVCVRVCVCVCMWGWGGWGGDVNGGVRHNLGEEGGFIYKWGDILI